MKAILVGALLMLAACGDVHPACEKEVALLEQAERAPRDAKILPYKPPTQASKDKSVPSQCPAYDD